MELAGALLYVKDFGRMRAFYAALLGAEPVNTEWPDQWAEFVLSGGARFGLHRIPPEIAAGIDIASPPEPRESTPVKLTLRAATADLEAERARLKGLGAAIVERPWGGLDAIDPEGNLFSVVAAPAAPK